METDETAPDPVERTPEEKQSMCERCGGCCCSFRSMGISFTTLGDKSIPELVNTPIDFEDVGGEAPGGTQLLRQSGDPVDMEWHLRDGDTLVFECNHLTDDGKCGIYEDRPDMCRRWECDALQGYTDLEEMLRKYAVDPATIDDADLENVTDRMNASLERLSERLGA